MAQYDLYFCICFAHGTHAILTFEIFKYLKRNRNIIKILKVDNDCLAHEILDMTFGIGIDCNSQTKIILPSFIFSVNEYNNCFLMLNKKKGKLYSIQEILKTALCLIKKYKIAENIPVDIKSKLKNDAMSIFLYKSIL